MNFIHNIDSSCKVGMPIQLALDHLERDWRDTGRVVYPILLQLRYKGELEDEAWRVSFESGRLTLYASSDLGFVFAIYAVSQQWLGIDPMWFWKGIEPDVSKVNWPEYGELNSQPNLYRFRGWFQNDEDILTDWWEPSGKRDLDYCYYHNVINLELFDHVCEALLRCGGNLLIPASFVDVMNPAEARLVEHAVQRGLYVTQHHIEPLGLSQFAYETYWRRRGVATRYAYHKEPERLIDTWRAYAAKWHELAGDQLIWQVGLRGRGDKPLWETDDSITKAEAGRVITEAIAKQVKIIAEIDPRTEPPTTMTLWWEASELLHTGQLHIPNSLWIIFCDDLLFDAVWTNVKNIERTPELKRGIYYHVAVWSAGPHLVRGCTLDRINRDFSEIISQGDIYFGIVNVANIREHVTPIQAVMGYFKKGIDLDRTTLCEADFGELADLYDRQEKAFVTIQDDRVLCDGTIQCIIRYILANEKSTLAEHEIILRKQWPYAMGKQYPDSASFVTALKAAATQQEAIASEASTQLAEPHERAFHHSQLVLQPRMQACLYRAFAEVICWGAPLSKRCAKALPPIDKLLDIMHENARGRWAGYYKGDTKFNVSELRRELFDISKRDISDSFYAQTK